MPGIGEELKKEREQKGITLKEIAHSTKISIRLLEALEENRLDILPGKFFNKAIISSYASYIGLDKNYVLNMYEESTFFQEQVKKAEQKRIKISPLIPGSLKRVINFVALFLILFAILYFLYFIFHKKENPSLPEKEVISTLPQEEKPIPPPVVESLPVETEVKALNIDITFLAETWVQIYADGELQIDGIKYPGDEVKVRALEDLLIHLGNAGGLSYTLNNKKGKPFGSSGAVVKNIRITLENLQEFMAPEEDPINDS